MYKEEITAWVDDHREEFLEDVKALVRIRSDRGEAKPGMPYGEGPASVLSEALTLAKRYGFYTANRENQVGTVDYLPETDYHLDILSHLDCVPVADGWSVTAPFDPIEKDGRLYGRGTSDDKGPSIAALYAMRCVKELGIPLQHNVRLIWGCDEECGSGDIGWYYQNEPEAKCTFSPDAEFPVINIEKGGMFGTISSEFTESQDLPRICEINAGLKINVVPDTCYMEIEGMRKSVADIYCAKAQEQTGVRFSITELPNCRIGVDAQGIGAHAASPEAGNNAITAMLYLAALMPMAPSPQFDRIIALAKLLPHGDYLGKGLGVNMADEISGELTLSMNILHVTSNAISAQFDARSPLCANDENMKEVIADNCAKNGLRLEDTPMRLPHYVPGDTEFVKTLLSTYSAYTGDAEAKPLAIGGGTYCHDLSNGVAFGCSMPGTDNHMHGNDEFAVVEELLTSVKIFADVIVRICG